MMRNCLLAIGWMAACVVVYGSVASIEVLWNLFEWRPRYHSDLVVAFGLLVIALGSLRIMASSGRARSGGLGLRLILWMCALGLLALGFYLAPAEVVSEGFLGRTTPSPAWYRVARCVLLGTPTLLLLLAPRLQPPAPLAENPLPERSVGRYESRPDAGDPMSRTAFDEPDGP